ncbi:MAG TPA: LLM class flavin-dependent oxidoreductase [Candidatus Limnocylindrales bacterium]|nr:LLM class flavin-dependent oxidoreductase [Candidatus Limnocylindrales bacterium]
MRFAIDVAPLGDLADPAAIVRLARLAEESGWDGISIWDSFGVSMGTSAADPFVALAGVAAATERLRLIVSVAALPRRRPQLVVQAAGTLDRLSRGRLVLGVGAGGDPADFETFGEPSDAATRVARLDESVALVDALLRGETVSHEGPAFAVRGAAVGPSPIQQPRPPIWFGAMRPGGLRRAAAWDGWIAIAVADDGSGMTLSPDDLRPMVERVLAERSRIGRASEAFDVAVFGLSGPDQRSSPAEYAEAGATWWLESLSGMRGSPDDLAALVRTGPPR